MLFKFHNDKPVYVQVSELIKCDMFKEVLTPGEKIASVRTLAKSYHVNPNTMQKALNLLEKEGYLITRGTSGKYVVDSYDFLMDEKERVLKSICNDFKNNLKLLGFTDVSVDIKKLLRRRD